MENKQTSTTSQFVTKAEDINISALKEMKSAKNMDDVENTMTKALKQAEARYGRPMTYAEMRGEFG